MIKLKNFKLGSLYHPLIHKILGWIVGVGLTLIGALMLLYGQGSGLAYLAVGIVVLPIAQVPPLWRLVIAALGLVLLL